MLNPLRVVKRAIRSGFEKLAARHLAQDVLDIDWLDVSDAQRIHLKGCPLSIDDLYCHIEGDCQCATVWVGRSCVGLGFIKWSGPRFNLESKEPEIHRLYIKPAYRCLGLGNKLIRFLETEAQKRGFSKIGLGIWKSNTRAYSLYFGLGYRKTEEFEDFDEKDFQPSDWLTKELK